MRGVLLCLLLPLACNASLATYLDALPFTATNSPAHTMSIGVGVYFEHLFIVNQKAHTYDADFWLVYRWQDQRNFSSLFYGPDGQLLHHVETETSTCASAAPSAPHGRRMHEVRALASSSTPGSGSGPSGPRHFVEFGHADLASLWTPDLHIRNAHGTPKVHAELIRLYEDGIVEQLSLTFCQLELHHPFYGSYPFDTQVLSVIIESLAHTTLQVVLTKLDQFVGVNMAATLEWPGWTLFNGDVNEAVHALVEDLPPDYTKDAGNTHRCEMRARFHLDIRIERAIGTIITTQFLPLILLVAVTWSAYYINIKVLMPRVAVGFISFLTLSNMAASFTSGLPMVSYDTWLNVFFTAHRLFVILSLLETAINVYVTDNLSTRVGLELDALSRWLMPLDYIGLLVVLFAFGPSYGNHNVAQYEAKLGVLSLVVFLNSAMVLALLLCKVLLAYRSVKRRLRTAPLVLHKQAIDTKPLDDRELRILFESLDADGNGLLSVEELVGRLIANDPVLKDNEAAGAPLLEKLKGSLPAELTMSKFIANHKAIFDELDLRVMRVKREKGAAGGKFSV